METDLNIKEIDLSKSEIPISNLKDSEIKELIETFNVDIQSKNFMKPLSEDNYLKFLGIFNNYNREGLNNDIKEISEKLFSSMKNTVESFTNLNKYEKELNDFQNKLNNNKLNDNCMVELEKIKKKNDFKYSTERINKLEDIIVRLSELEPDNEFIKRVVEEYYALVNYINKDSKIRIALLGLYSSGKSTILNTIIGKNILPTNSNECTKRGIIIRYHNNDIPQLYKTKFIKKEKLDYYLFEDSNEPVCSGFNDVKKELEKLNEDNKNFEDSFYILKIKIEFYDEYNIEDELKEKIELIDFPGLHTANNFYEQNIFGPLMKFTDGFIFVNKNDLIKEGSNFEALIDIIDKIESKKFGLNTDTFLFILNNFKTKELKIENAKKELDEIIFGKIIEKKGFWSYFKKEEKYETKLNVVQFNAKCYLNYMNFKEEISDFKSFMKKCLDDMKQEGEKNLFKYFN